MPITIVSSSRARHQLEHQQALQEGFLTYSIEAKLEYSIFSADTKYVACWGWHNGKQLRDRGHEVLVMERGYIGDRFKYTSLGWNGLNGHAEFPVHKSDNGERFKDHGGVIKPWKREGNYALILGQVPRDASLQGKNMVPWYENIAFQIKEKYNIPVLFRQHPDLNKRGINQIVGNTEKSTGTLSEALSGALFTVCYNSNSAVDSILAGVPCIVGDEGTMAYQMCGHEVGELIYPDREQWAYDLAWKQWDIEEIKSGKALENIICRLGV